jgi:acylphosphatase
MEAIHRVVILVRGRVQGVGYRYSAYQVATGLDLKGFVKNLGDGSVQLEAQGPQDALMVLVEWCKKGPSRAVVDSVEYGFEPPANFVKFQIR